ncbi:MAG TPA: endonuclease/exonuclease/phosphatase family protein [Anaeromyxobacteraceae bacterium]|nr:endonuclease/exonuclease/phosphatase family protein [Anaeromyxobacteraceae bacterium]
MFSRAAPLLIAAAVTACVPRPQLAAPTPPATVKVATWNVKDFFDAKDDPRKEDDVPAEAAVARKIELLATVLREIDADVILLQEVENVELLQRLAVAAAPLHYGAYLREGADPRGIDVALLARTRLLRYDGHLHDLDSSGKPLWSRDLVEAHLDAGGRQLVIVGSHLKSKRISRSDDRRREQAERMRAVADDVRARWPAALVVIAGDLNDDPDSWSLQPLLEDGTWVDLGSRLPDDAAWTWSSRGRGRSRLDYLIVPRAQEARVRSLTVWSSPAVMQASDHRPVVAVIEVGR